MSTSTQTVHSRGIYHGLPVYPSSLKGLTAVITGANGISGYHMLKVLAQDPERWTKIYCLSRRPPAIPGGLPKHAEHIACDFMTGAEEIAKVLKDNNVTADYVFFYSYIQVPPKPGGRIWSDAEEMTRVNTQLWNNFLGSLPLADITPKRIMLQTGAKQYGIHLGPAQTPQEESDPRVELEPNFYYPQEDALFAHCEKYGLGWNVGRPSNIIGAVPDAAMNLVYPLGVYAAVCAHLGQPLAFPGDLVAWENVTTQSSAMLDAYLEEWSVLNEHTKNQAFNCVDDSPFSWGKAWPQIASWHGIEWRRPDLDAEFHEVEMGHDPPPRGFGPKGKIRLNFSLTDWAKRSENAQAWKEIAEKHGLVEKELRDPDRVFGFLDGGIHAKINLSMNKAKKMGWHGFVDTVECIRETTQDFVDIKMLPPLPTKA